MEENRVCRYCNIEFPIEGFPVANIVNGKIYWRQKCKKCYHATKKDRKIKIKTWLDEYKKKMCCEKCGEPDFRILDFHHDSNDGKDFNIGDAVRLGFSLDKIEKEITKCKILCCKCHRILHWEEDNRV